MKYSNDYNSSANQDVKGKLVDREVIQNCSYMMQEMGRLFEHLDGDDQETLTALSGSYDYETAIDDWIENADIDELEQISDHLSNEVSLDELNDLFPQVRSVLIEGIDRDDDQELCNQLQLDPEHQEACEFWCVTDWFANKLREQGQEVHDFLGFTIWARYTTGQAILLDYVVSEIAENMEILEGQANHAYWAKQEVITMNYLTEHKILTDTQNSPYTDTDVYLYVSMDDGTTKEAYKINDEAPLDITLLLNDAYPDSDLDTAQDIITGSPNYAAIITHGCAPDDCIVWTSCDFFFSHGDH